MENEQNINIVPDEIISVEQPAQPKPWGFWATIGFFCIIVIAYLFATGLTILPFAIPALSSSQKFDSAKFFHSLESNGLFISVSTISGAIVIVLLVLLFTGIKKQISIKQYLCLKNPGLNSYFKWALIFIFLVICSDTLTWLLGRPIVPDVMIQTYATAYFPPILWFALIIVVPVSEELLMRGFLFKGIECSRLGPIGAIIITSFVWSILHTQYDLYGIASIFISGLLLGLARLKTKSVYIPVAMHSLMSLIATVECVIVMTGI